MTVYNIIYMKRDNLDNIDIKILSLLQKDGRITNVDLAEKVDLSAPPCLRRVRSLEKNGFIKGYHADLQAEKLGFETIVNSKGTKNKYSSKGINVLALTKIEEVVALLFV